MLSPEERGEILQQGLRRGSPLAFEARQGAGKVGDRSCLRITGQGGHGAARSHQQRPR